MKFLYALLIMVPVTLVLKYAGIGGHAVLFVCSALALIALAAVLGRATDDVSTYTGQKIGGLLNATLGNAAELIITIVALREGLVEVVKASIAGSIIGNMLFVLGFSVLFGGLKNGRQKFDARHASTNASTMSLAVLAMIIPAVFALGSPKHRPSDRDIVRISDGVAIVLIIFYGLYLLYTIFGGATPESGAEEESEGRMSLPVALGLLAAATIAIVFTSEILVGALEPTAKDWGMTDLFVGVMLVPLVGNIAEHLVAVQMALKNKMDLTFGIAVGSGLQIALFVSPVLVLISRFVGPDPITLVFNPFEMIALIGAVIVAIMISVDGESNWLEGVQLIGLYAILAIAFFVVP